MNHNGEQVYRSQHFAEIRLKSVSQKFQIFWMYELGWEIIDKISLLKNCKNYDIMGEIKKLHQGVTHAVV